MKLIDKDALIAEIERIEYETNYEPFTDEVLGKRFVCKSLLSFIDTLEVKDSYEQCVQYDSIRAGIQAHAETYSFNIESKLFNQLTKEQQELWRKEIEQACISGGDMGVELARDTRYKENLEVKENDLLTEEETEKELAESYINLFDKKFGNKLPNLRGKQLAEFKNFINTCEQTFYMKYFDYHATQGKLFEKLALLWAAWGKEHLSLKVKEVDLEEASEKYACRFTSSKYGHDKIKATFKDGAKWQSKKEQDIIETAEDHAFLAGANWQKEQMMKDAVDADAVFDYYDDQDRLYVSILATDVLAKKYSLKDRDKPKIIIVKEN